MALGNTLLTFFPQDGEAPAANYALLGSRNNHPTLQFDDTTQWTILFTAVLPRHYGGGGVTVYLHWSAVATTGTVGWQVAFERVGAAAQDIDADGFAADQTVTATTVDGTSGNVKITSVAVSDGANLDSVAVGEVFRLRVRRDVANDNAVGNAELLAVELKET